MCLVQAKDDRHGGKEDEESADYVGKCVGPFFHPAHAVFSTQEAVFAKCVRKRVDRVG